MKRSAVSERDDKSVYSRHQCACHYINCSNEPCCGSIQKLICGNIYTYRGNKISCYHKERCDIPAFFATDHYNGCLEQDEIYQRSVHRKLCVESGKAGNKPAYSGNCHYGLGIVSDGQQHRSCGKDNSYYKAEELVDRAVSVVAYQDRYGKLGYSAYRQSSCEYNGAGTVEHLSECCHYNTERKNYHSADARSEEILRNRRESYYTYYNKYNAYLAKQIYAYERLTLAYLGLCRHICVIHGLRLLICIGSSIAALLIWWCVIYLRLLRGHVVLRLRLCSLYWRGSRSCWCFGSCNGGIYLIQNTSSFHCIIELNRFSFIIYYY